MYADWVSLQDEIQCDKANQSVLDKFPSQVGTIVASSVVKHIATSLSIAANNLEPSNLHVDKEVKWTMEVLCFGLSLPLAELDTIKECVNVYCEWLSACMPTPRQCVPKPVKDDPNPYAQVMIHHLLNLFVPRLGSGVDHVKRQAVLCHRVLRMIETVAVESTILSRESWETLLKFLLAANDSLLSPPTEKDDIGDHLCERVLSVLFRIWLLACHKCFPSPSLWKTFRSMCVNWRHHEALIAQWHKVNHTLTAHILRFMHGPEYPELPLTEEESQLIPANMTDDCIAQCWFRFLHIIQNPVDLCHPDIIGQTPRFRQMALSADSVFDPMLHECLHKLPHIFYKAMRGISIMVNAFLGIPQNTKAEGTPVTTQSTGRLSVSAPSTPPGQRKTTRPMSVFSGSITKGGSKGSTSAVTTPKSTAPPIVNYIGMMMYEPRQPVAASRPDCNSILHLFGAWLFDAALARVRLHHSHVQIPEKTGRADRRSSSFTDTRHNSISLDFHPELTLPGDNTYETGRAEALGALCRVFCAHKTGETILPVYYSRFYIAMYYGLQTAEECISGQVLSSILFNSGDLLRVDLDGVMILLPHILEALELFLNDLPSRNRINDSSVVIDNKNVELKRACINLLLSTLCLPLHFKDLEIRDIVSSTNGKMQMMTFMSKKKKIIEMVLRALQTATDSTNTQMLLGGLMLLVQDMAMCESAEQMTLQPQESNLESDSNAVFADSSQTSVGTSSSESSYREASYHKLTNASQDNDSAYGLFGDTTSLVCHCLMTTWKTDLNNALAAIELLSGLAKVVIKPQNLLTCKRTVKWICEFIVNQCNRPPPFHSKDLHSMIVAAYKCLTLWLVEHNRLLYDKECLHDVLEVVELGISGSKSQTRVYELHVQSLTVKDSKPTASVKKLSRSRSSPVLYPKPISVKYQKQISFQDVETLNKATDVPKFKGEKVMNPASKRVQEAANGVLTCIIQHVGAFPPPCGPESLFSLLDEKSLLKYSKGSGPPEQGSPFRYFVLENSIIVGLLEQPLGNFEDPLPTVTALIRGPFGRHAWTMQLRHSPRVKKVNSKSHLIDPGRPLPMDNVGTHHHLRQRFFPETVNSIPFTKADKSIPTLESLVTDNQRSDLNKLKGFIEKQTHFERQIEERSKNEMKKLKFPDPETECRQPKITQEYQTARLFLSHYGFLSLDALKDPSNSSLPPALVMLDTTNSGLFADLDMLDMLTARDNDTVHVFYVKSGQKNSQDILNNVQSQKNVQPQFLEFLHSLGWPVDIKKHAGWTGHISTSWKISEPEDLVDDEYITGTGGSIYDGQHQVLYWADVLSEVAFVVPSPDTVTRMANNNGDKSPMLAPSHKIHDKISIDHSHIKPSTLSLDKSGQDGSYKSRFEKESPGSPHDAPTRSKRFGRQPILMTGPDTKVFVVWLENFEDHKNFPSGDLLPLTSTGLEQYTSASSSSMKQGHDKDVFFIFIHALQNGLFRIHMESQAGRISMAIPLVDGMVVSRRTLGTMVRQTAINICKRKRLESESYQPPHVRRKVKIQEIVSKYFLKMAEPEFYTALFQDVVK